MDRPAFLRSLIGRPWSSSASCWHLAREVERALFAREMPDHPVPENPTWEWMIDAIESHPERAMWREVPRGPHGLITARDGALVLMARARHPAHIGVWLKPERAIIHADQGAGVMLELSVALEARGWRHLVFFEPA